MSSYEVIKGFLESEDFKANYRDYLKKKDNHLLEFLDNIDLNKKYYRMNINKNKRYKKETTEDTTSIKEINSMINKITNTNYIILKKEIIQKITVDHIIPYIIQKLVENSMIHHIYIQYYVGILKEINSPKKNISSLNYVISIILNFLMKIKNQITILPMKNYVRRIRILIILLDFLCL